MSSKTLVAPLFLVLDGTTSDNFVTRRAAEAWMRCHFRSYLRLVDPLLSVIADASVERQELEVASGPCTVRLHYYNSPFDQARAVHALSNLHGLFVSRGAAFQKVMKTTPLRESANPDVRGLTHGGGELFSCPADTSFSYAHGHIRLYLSRCSLSSIDKVGALLHPQARGLVS